MTNENRRQGGALDATRPVRAAIREPRQSIRDSSAPGYLYHIELESFNRTADQRSCDYRRIRGSVPPLFLTVLNVGAQPLQLPILFLVVGRYALAQVVVR